ncbi:MAG TPA: inositol monophosphatase family protein [Gemmatimonadales bacterium]|nr:inositol monophosphatase family protein [Gemmatimonadales bacterium]
MLSHLDLRDIARRAAKAGADFLRATPRPDAARWEAKGPQDWVTTVDREAEERIRAMLEREAPGSRVVGEELGPEMVSGGLVWVVDPLDGTTNFLHGFPAFGVSIGAQLDGQLVAGVIHDVPRDIVYHGAIGHGAWANDAPIAVSPLREPAQALIGTGFPFKNADRAEEYLAQMQRLMGRTSGMRRPGSAALDLAWVAQGAFDAFWELELAPWDISAGIVLVRAAGGKVTDLSGRDIGAEHTSVCAGNPWLHEWVLRTLHG